MTEAQNSNIKEEPYNRIVLIGNGFDKALGLKTSYADFIFHYIREAAIHTFRDRSYETKLYSFILFDRQFLLSKDEYIQEIKCRNTIKELSEYLTDKIKIIPKYTFFGEILNNLKNDRWVDIEQFYYDTLKKKFHLYKEKQMKSKKDDLTSIIELNKCMDNLTDELNNFISKQQNAISIEYWKSPMASLIDSIRAPLEHKRSTLVERHNRQNAPSTVIFLNFNYTTTVLQMLNNSFVGTNNKHLFIHGAVNSDENPIIFGYGDDTGEDYKELEVEGENELLRKIKSFQYPRTHNYHNLLNYLHGNEFDVFIIGHSCGLSDRTLLKTIFEHPNCLCIQNFHYKGELEDFNKRMEISRHFTNKVLMRERVLPYDKFAIIPQIP